MNVFSELSLKRTHSGMFSNYDKEIYPPPPPPPPPETVVKIHFLINSNCSAREVKFFKKNNKRGIFLE